MYPLPSCNCAFYNRVLLRRVFFGSQVSFQSKSVERLYCKRPIQCLASSKILTPHLLTARRVCTVYPPAFCAGGGHTRWVERGWGVNILEDARHCSGLYIRKYFVGDMYHVWAWCSVGVIHPRLSQFALM